MFDVMSFSKEQIFADLQPLLTSQTLLKKDEPLAKKTTLRVGGPADVYVEPTTESELSQILKFCRQRDVRFFVLGRGSNLLIRDGGIRGVVISLAHPTFSRIEIDGGKLRCGAGAKLKAVSVEARRHNLAGLEFLEGIPGSVGGALRMNAGAMGGATFDFVEMIRIMDQSGDIHELQRNEILVKYRSCPLLKENIAISAVFKGEVSSPEVIAEKMKIFSNKRWDSQPAQPSAGCVFKNLPTIPAGRLVDELGLKGTRVGNAVVSDVHGNFIVNEGNAKAADVLQLIGLIKERAREARGIELETEVEIVGEN